MKRGLSIALFLAALMISSTVLASITISNNAYIQQKGVFDDTQTELEWSQKDANYRQEAGYTQRFTSNPNPDGSVYDTFITSSRTYTMPSGEKGLLDQDMGVVGSDFTNLNPANSLHTLTIAGGQSNGMLMQSNFDYYSESPGQIDRYGGEYNFTFIGLGTYPNLPADLLPAGQTIQTFETGSAENGLCLEDNACGYFSNHLILPLCDAHDCTGQTHNTHVRIANGDYSPSNTQWSLHTDQIDESLMFKLSNGDLATGNADFYIRTSGESEWRILENGDTVTSSFIEYMIAPNASKYPTSSAIPHSIRGEMPTAYLINTSHDEDWDVEATHTVWYQDHQAFLSAQATPTTKRLMEVQPNEGDEENFTVIDVNLTADFIVWDPELVYVEDNNVWSTDAKTSMSWRQGVDRDGSTIYGYNNDQRDNVNGGQAFPITYNNLVVGTKNSASYSADCGAWDGSSLMIAGNCGSWDNFETGDGWCGENTNYGHAGCAVQGLDAYGGPLGAGGSTHWNTDYLPALPLIDSTYDFDGTVIKIDMDRDSWISQGNAGYRDLHVEVGLQSMGYSNALSSNGWNQNLASPGQWIGANGGWYENCFNGFIDLFAIPENDFDNWYGEAQYTYDWAPGQNNGYAYDSTDPSSTGTINWGIRPDGDRFSYDEYYYREVGPSNNDPLVSMTNEKGDGYVDGPQAAGGYHTYDRSENGYWAKMYSAGYYGGNELQNPQMAVNNFQAHRLPDGYKVLNNDNFENGGGIYTGDMAPGSTLIPASVSDLEFSSGLKGSSFQHVADYWDINFYSDEDFPFGPSGFYDSSIGTMTPEGFSGATTSMSHYQLETVQLGNDEEDFCYDPISTTGIARENSMIGVEQNSNLLLAHDSVEGQTYLNIDIGSNPADNVLAESATMSTTELVSHGWLDDATDTTISFYMLIDIRSANPFNTQYEYSPVVKDEDHWYPDVGTNYQHAKIDTPNGAVCWGDWSAPTDRFDTEDGHWWDNSGLNLYHPSTPTGYDHEASFCLDEDGSSSVARSKVTWQEFIDTISCVSDMPQSGQSIGQNPEKAFWCGLNLMSPENDDVEPIRIIAQSGVYWEDDDDDRDGVANSDDLCPGTDTFQEVDSDGCPITNTADGNGTLEDDQDENLPYDGSGDIDGDGVADWNDVCDRAEGVGYAPDRAHYTSLSHQTWIAAGKPTVQPTYSHNPGCPQLYQQTNDDDDEEEDYWNDGSEVCESTQPDIGIYPYENNDGDYDDFGNPLIDEDWIDGIDNDGDGRIDEDPFDDCRDSTTLVADANFKGYVETILSLKTSDGLYIPKSGDQLIAEQDKKWDDVYSASFEKFSQTQNVNGSQSDSLIFHNDLESPQSVQLMCNSVSYETTNTNLQLYVWVPYSVIEAADMSYDGNFNPGRFGLTGKTNFTDPGGSGVIGVYLPYGAATGFHDSANPLPAHPNITSKNYSGYAITAEGQLRLASTTGFQTDNDAIMYANFAEGHYRLNCIGLQTNTLSTGQTYTVEQVVTHDFVAVAFCDSGSLPNPPLPGSICTSGGGGITTSDGLNSLLDDVQLLGFLLLTIALAGLLWFIGWRSVAVGLGLASVTITWVTISPTDQELLGTAIHLLLFASTLLIVSALANRTKGSLGGWISTIYFLYASLWFAAQGWIAANPNTELGVAEAITFGMTIPTWAILAIILSLVCLGISVLSFLALIGVNDIPLVPEEWTGSAGDFDGVPGMLDLDEYVGAGLLGKAEQRRKVGR
jgi:hypothetical protein